MDPTDASKDEVCQHHTYKNLDRIGNPQRSLSVNAHVIARLTDNITGNPNSMHGLGTEAKRRITIAKQSILACFPAFDAVELLPGGGSNACRRAVEDSINFHPSSKLRKDVVLMSQMEHKSVHTYATRNLTERGYFVVKVPSTRVGQVSVPAFEALLKEYGSRIALVSILSVNNEIGTIQPIEELYSRVKAVSEGIVFHSDVCHGLQLPSVAVPDITTFSAFKLGGDHVGVLLRKTGVKLVEAYFGTPDVLAAETTAIAVQDAVGIAAASLLEFKKRLACVVENVFTKYGVSYANLSPLGVSLDSTQAYVTSCLQGDALVQALSSRGVLVSSGSACMASVGRTAAGTVGSYVVRSMGYSNKSTFNLLRFSYTASEVNSLDMIATALDSSVCKMAALVKAPQRAARLSTNAMEAVVCGPVLRGGLAKHSAASLQHPLVGGLRFNKIRVCPDEAFLKGSQQVKFLAQVESDISKRIASSGISGVVVCKDNMSILLIEAPATADGTATSATDASTASGLGDNCLRLLSRVPGIILYYPVCSFANTKENESLLYSYLATLYTRALENRVRVSGDSKEAFTFRVTVKLKAIKRHLGKSQQELNMLFGQYIVDRFQAAVDLQRPTLTLSVDISSASVDVFDCRYPGLTGLPIGSEGVVGCVVAADNVRRSLVSVWQMSCRGASMVCYITEDLTARPLLLEEFKRCCRVVNPYVCFTQMPSLSVAVSALVNSDEKVEYTPQSSVEKLQAVIAQDLVVIEPSDLFLSSSDNSRASDFLLFCSMWKMIGKLSRKLFFSASMAFDNEEIERLIGAWQLGSSLDMSSSAMGTGIKPGGGTLMDMARVVLTTAHVPGSLHCKDVDAGCSVGLGIKVLGMLSGGIDSPVAMHLGAHTLGMDCSYVHFSSSIDKIGAVSDIVHNLKKSCRKEFRPSLFIVEFQRLQDEIVAICSESYRTMMYKIYFVLIATKLAQRSGCVALLTGNSMGQVASQTPKNLLETDMITNLPVLSPLLGMSKTVITSIAKTIGTYELSTNGCTSDCCVMYLPTNPVLSAKETKIEQVLEKIPNFMDFVNIRENIIDIHSPD